MFKSLWAKEPGRVVALLMSIVVATITLLVVFGIKITADQSTAIGGMIASVGALFVAAEIARSQTTPLNPPPASKTPNMPPGATSAFLVLIAFVVVGCTMARSIVRDATGAACEIVLQDVVHNSSPQICTTVVEVEQFVADWVAAHKAASPGMPQPRPSAQDIYVGIAAKRGIAIK